MSHSTNSPTNDYVTDNHGPTKTYDLPALESGSSGSVNNLANAIRESTATMIKAMGAPRTTIGIASCLGLFAFAVPNFGNAMWQLGLINNNGVPAMNQPMANPGMMAPVFMAFVGQFLAGLWNLTKGDTFGAVAMGAYGLFWLMYWWYIWIAAPEMVSAYFTGVSSGGSGLGTSALVAYITTSPAAAGFQAMWGGYWNSLTGSAPTAATAPLAIAAWLTDEQRNNVGFLLTTNTSDSLILPALAEINLLFGYLCIPWLILTTIFIFCALRMALLEFWIFIAVEMVFICVIGGQFSYPGTSTNIAWTKAGGAMSLILAITAWYFIAVILVNSTYNAPILPMGHSTPLIMNWPHEFGSVMHQDTHRKLNLYLPEKKLRRGATSDHGQMNYNAENEMHRSHNVAGHPMADVSAEKQV